MLLSLFALSTLTLALTGRVVDKSGQPLAGVAVTLEKQKLSGVTDAQGRFSFATSLAPVVRDGGRAAPAPEFSADGRLLTKRARVLRLAKGGPKAALESAPAAKAAAQAAVSAAGDDTL